MEHVQRNVEVIDNTTNTTSSFLYFVHEKNIFNLINIYRCKVFHVCLAYLDKLPFSNLNQAYSFFFVSHTKLNGIRNDLSDDCLTVLPCTTMEIP